MKAQTVWVLVTGLAIGFIFGRELPRGKSSGETSGDKPTATAKSATAPPGEISPSWLKEDVFPKAKDKFVGLTPAQRITVLKYINERKCDCGCPHTVAQCLKDDPDCGTAPGLLASAVDLVKQNKTFAEIMAQAKKGGGAAAPAAPPPSVNQKIMLAKWTPVKGPADAKVTIVLFSDFQWPFCARVGPTLKEIEQKYGKQVRVAFMHQPLPFHDKARGAAEATMAAHAQGKFWEMHDKLFANNKALDRPDLDRYAQELGLNMARYKADMDGHKFKAEIDADAALGTKSGASGTPTFFINGRQLVGAQPIDAFSKIIDEEIKHADELLKKGVKPAQLYDEILKTLAAAPPAAAAPTPGAEKVDITPPADSPFKGPKDAVVTLLEFSDFQWPFCSRVGPTLKQLEQDYKGKIKIVFMHQPLPFHDKAHLAAEATMAAHAQGKFWEMHDKLFENNKALDRPDLERYAQEIGLNVAKFKAALDSGAFKARVDADSAAGTKAGAGGTPTFFINGRKLVGAQPVEQFKTVIDEELKKKK